MSFLLADSNRYWVLKAAIVPILAHGALLGLYELDRNIAWTLLFIGVGFLGVIIGERFLKRSRRRKILFILVVGAILRILMLPLSPSLSDDVYRYIWDGKVLAAGFNPYLSAPEDPVLEPLRDELWERLPHKDVATVYPPFSEGLFGSVASLPASVWVWKLLLTSIDLLSCVMLIVLLRRRRVSIDRTVWYVWNPLVTIEIAGMGHVDGLGVAAVLMTVVLLQLPRKRIFAGAIAAAISVLIKIVPILAFPVFARQSKRPIIFLAIASLLVVIGVIPVMWTIGGVPSGLVEYGVSWEFNGPLFEPLWRGLDRLEFSDLVSTALDSRKEASGEHEFWNRFYPLNYPQLWAKLFLMAGLCVAVAFAWREKDTVGALRKVFGYVVIFSATVYPWYLLWVLPWATITRDKAWLMLSGLVMLCYVPQFSTVPLFPWIHALIWVPFAGALMVWRR